MLSVDGDDEHGDLSGHVIAMEIAPGEPPDFDWCRTLSRLIWFTVVVVSPPLAAHLVLMKFGGLSAGLTVVGLFFVLKFMLPGNIFSLVRLAIMLNPLGRPRNEPQVPVRYLRVRRENGAEAIVRIKGHLRGANVAMDDMMTFWGQWRHHVLMCRNALNRNTGSRLEIVAMQSWASLVLSILAMLLLVIYIIRVLLPMVELARMGL